MVVVTLESWHLMSRTVRQELAAKVIDRMQKATLPLQMIDEIPWQVMSAQEIEQGAQVINSESLVSVLAAKVSEPSREWGFNGFVQHTRPDWLAGYRSLFPGDEAKLFPGSMTKASA